MEPPFQQSITEMHMFSGKLMCSWKDTLATCHMMQAYSEVLQMCVLSYYSSAERCLPAS